MVGAADDAFLFHALHDAGGAVVADLQVALDKRRAGLALAADQSHRLVVESVFLAAAFAATRAGRPLFSPGIGGHRPAIASSASPRAGNECVRPCRSPWAPNHYNKHNTH